MSSKLQLISPEINRKHCTHDKRMDAIIKRNVQKIIKTCAGFYRAYTKVGTIQTRLAWPLHKDDVRIHEAAWKIPWTEEPGRLQSMGSLRVGHD